MEWVKFSLITVLSVSIYGGISKYFSNKIPPQNLLFYLCVIEGILSFIVSDKKALLKLGKLDLGLMIICGAICFTSVICDQMAIKLAPTIGHHYSVRSSAIVIGVLISVFFFDGKITTKEIIGILMVLTGILLVTS